MLIDVSAAPRHCHGSCAMSPCENSNIDISQRCRRETRNQFLSEPSEPSDHQIIRCHTAVSLEAVIQTIKGLPVTRSHEPYVKENAIT